MEEHHNLENNGPKPPKRSAYIECIRLLARRDYSRIKLQRKLLEKHFPQEEIEDALETVTEEGYLREDAYISARVRGFMHKGWAPSHIQKKLRQEDLNVSLQVINEIFLENHTSPKEQIQWLIAKKLPSELPHRLDHEAWSKLKRKLLTSLSNKGHHPSECFDAVGNTIDRLKNS